jgi:hypothetical protein
VKQPAFTVGIVKGRARRRFGFACRAMKIIAFNPRQLQLLRQCFSKCGFAATGYIHDDHRCHGRRV